HGQSRQAEDADRDTLAQERRADHTSITAEFLRLAPRVSRVVLRIENLDRCALEQRAAGHGIAPRFEWDLLQFLQQLLRKAIVSLGTKIASFIWTYELPDVRLADPNGRLDQRVEHLLQVECRAADQLEHVGSRRLLVQRLLCLVEQPRVLDRNQRLI